MDKHDCGFVSAYITDDQKKELIETEPLSQDELEYVLNTKNRVKSNNLFRTLKELGYKLTQFRGYWPPNKELSWLIVNVEDDPNFRDNLTELARIYAQESAMICLKGTQDAYTVSSGIYKGQGDYGEVMDKFNKRYIGGVGDQEYKSVLKGNRGIIYDYEEPKKDTSMTESNKYKHDFNKVYESYFSRYTAGLFGPGDVVEFDKGLLSDPMFKNLAPDMQSAVQSMVEASIAGDAIVAVTKTNIDPRLQDNYEAATITIAYSQGGGMYYGQVTIPGSLGKYMKRTTDVYSVIPKRAIKVHDGGVRQPVDMEKVKQAFKSGKVEDVRTINKS